MARFEFKLPDIGEGVTEGEIVTWLVEPGQVVAEGAPMVEVMTDKATVTIAAPKSGRVVETFGRVGESVKVHSVLVVFELDAKAESDRGAGNGTTKRKEDKAASAVGDIREDLPGMALAPRRGAKSTAAASAYFNDKPLATPATRKLARDLGLDLRAVRPTGAFGRVTSEDLRGAATQPIDAPEGRAASEAPPPPPAAPSRARGVDASKDASLEERTPLKGLRKRIFENMARSKG